MKRREFKVGGAAVAWPLAAHAQQPEHARRLGIFVNLAETDQEGQRSIEAFRRGLRELGGSKTGTSTSTIAGRPAPTRAVSAQLRQTWWRQSRMSFSPAPRRGWRHSQCDQHHSDRVCRCSDPVGQGFVSNLARPGEHNRIHRLRVLDGRKMDRNFEGNRAQSYPRGRCLQSKNSAIFSVVFAFDRDRDFIGRCAVGCGAGERRHRYRTDDHRIRARAKRRFDLPLESFTLFTVRRSFRWPRGIGYQLSIRGASLLQMAVWRRTVSIEFISYRRAAPYVDRILKGSSSRATFRFSSRASSSWTINLSSARALGLTIPQTLQASADEVIE